VRASQLRAQGLEQLNRGAVDRAIALLQQAAQLDPNNALIKRDLDRAVRIGAAVKRK
jgi:Flp pilus assembly protein TadD